MHLRREIRTQDRQLVNFNDRVNKLEVAAQELNEDNAALEVTLSTKEGIRLDTHGMVAIAVRRIMTIVACSGFGVLTYFWPTT